MPLDLLDAALLDLCLEYILPKVPLKALACLTLASGQAHALVLRAISAASFWEQRAATCDRIKAARPSSKGELLRIVEQASELVELAATIPFHLSFQRPQRVLQAGVVAPVLWLWDRQTALQPVGPLTLRLEQSLRLLLPAAGTRRYNGQFTIDTAEAGDEERDLEFIMRGCFPACEAAQLPCLFNALVGQLAPPQVVEMVQKLRSFKIRLTHPEREPMPAAKATGWESLKEGQLWAGSRHRAAWTAELVLQLACLLNQTDAYDLMVFASDGFGTVDPFDVARLFAADWQPSERPAFYISALSFEDSTCVAIEPLVALAQSEPLQFVFDTIAAFAAADEHESQYRDCVYCQGVNADSYAADFVEAWAQQVDFPHSWSVPDRLAMAHAVTSCNEVAKKGLARIVVCWLPSIVEVPMRPPTPPPAIEACPRLSHRGPPACLGLPSGPERRAFGCRSEAVTSPWCLAIIAEFAI